jgi:hypothetical protein
VNFPLPSIVEQVLVPGIERCALCNKAIFGRYYRVSAQMACPACTSEARQVHRKDELSGSPAAFQRALLFGIAAAIFGIIVCANLTILTGWTPGFLALAVGWFVGAAIRKGANGLGGRRYQYAAVLLTYAAVSLSAIPAQLYFAFKYASSIPEWGAFLQHLFLVSLVSPFASLGKDPLTGFVGLFALSIGSYIAWQLTRTASLEVNGPYSLPDMLPPSIGIMH